MENEFHKPEILSKGAQVSLVNPSSQQDERFHRNNEISEYLTNLGFEVSDHTSLLGKDEERIAKFNEAVRSGAKALFPVAGNNYSEYLVKNIDFESFEKFDQYRYRYKI